MYFVALAIIIIIMWSLNAFLIILEPFSISFMHTEKQLVWSIVALAFSMAVIIYGFIKNNRYFLLEGWLFFIVILITKYIQLYYSKLSHTSFILILVVLILLMVMKVKRSLHHASKRGSKI